MSDVCLELWPCSGLLRSFLLWMNGCISAQTRRMYRFVMFSILCLVMMGFVCVNGGWLTRSLMILLCVLMSGCM